MKWEIEYTTDADRDLGEIYSYIADVLLEPAIAEKQVNRLMDAADSLNHMPFRHRLYDHEPWHSRGVRVFPVKKYLILYFPNELRNVVEIIRIIYGGRDIEAQLEK
jgi:toxin ParE1/3/4